MYKHECIVVRNTVDTTTEGKQILEPSALSVLLLIDAHLTLFKLVFV